MTDNITLFFLIFFAVVILLFIVHTILSIGIFIRWVHLKYLIIAVFDHLDTTSPCPTVDLYGANPCPYSIPLLLNLRDAPAHVIKKKKKTENAKKFLKKHRERDWTTWRLLRTRPL